MWTNIVGILGLGMIAFIILAVRAKKKKTGNMKRWILYAVGCFILAIVANSFVPAPKQDNSTPASANTTSSTTTSSSNANTSDESATNNRSAAQAKQDTTSPAPAPTKQPTLEDKIIKDINGKLESKTNEGKKRLVDLIVNDYIDPAGGKFVQITLNANNSMTSSMSRDGMLQDSQKVFQSIFANKEVNCVSLFWQLPMTDAYGKNSDDIVMKIKLDRATYSKINWDNFDFNNYPTIANFYFEHPAFKE
jgi:hypothetical protein